MAVREYVRFQSREFGGVWEDASILGYREYVGDYKMVIYLATKDAQVLADHTNTEIRWNVVGSAQGHYVSAHKLPELELEPHEPK